MEVEDSPVQGILVEDMGMTHTGVASIRRRMRDMSGLASRTAGKEGMVMVVGTVCRWHSVED